MSGLPDITFNISQGGLGRAPAGEDHISGMIFYIANGFLPSGFSTSSRIKNVFSIEQAEALGIDLSYSDETPGEGTVSVTTAGTNGDIITVTFLEPNGTTVTLGQYTKVSGDNTVTLVATAITAAINALTYIHGYTATSAIGVVTIVYRDGLGIWPNSGTPLAATIVGATMAVTVTQATVAGVASKIAVFHYHISEYFRLKPNGNLWVGLYASIGAAYEEVTLVRDAANGAIRQMAVFHAFAATTIATDTPLLQAVAAAGFTDHKPFSILKAPEISGTAALSSLNNLSTLNSAKVSNIISQDGAAKGYLLYLTTGKSITDIGAKLGALSASKVSESWAWIGKFNMSDGVELDTVAFSNGVTYESTPTSQLNTLTDYGYCFLRKLVGFTGSYNNQPNTSTTFTSDYRYIYNNRTIDKVVRQVRLNTLPALSGDIVLNSNGTMADTTIAYYVSLAASALDIMVRDGEISAYKVTIDPAQNVLSTNKIVENIKILPIGKADFIEINIGLTTKID